MLAGFKIDQTRNQLRTLAVTRQVADLTLLSTIENTKANVRTAYWNLRQAIEQIEIQRRALDLARRLFEDNRVKVEIGTLAPIDTVQPEAQVATAEQACSTPKSSGRRRSSRSSACSPTARTTTSIGRPSTRRKRRRCRFRAWTSKARSRARRPSGPTC